MGKRLVAIVVLLGVMVAQLAIFLYGLERRAERSAPFTILLSPTLVPDAVVGAAVTLNVSVREDGQGDLAGDAVNLSAIAPGATVRLAPASVAPGGSAQLLVTPGEALAGRNLTVTVYGRRGRKVTATAVVMVSAP